LGSGEASEGRSESSEETELGGERRSGWSDAPDDDDDELDDERRARAIERTQRDVASRFRSAAER
jgi:hypothetical protein